MKRIISLLLVFTLIISCMLTVSASISPDANLAYLLSDLNIMSGDPDGNLRLGDYVSRAEFAKISVASSMYRNTVSKTLAISPFKDVLSTHWAAPYIQVAVTNGIISGYPDGSFKPSETVSYEEAVTVFLKLLGYTDKDFGISWPHGQIGIAEKIGLCDDFKLNVGQKLSRLDVMQLIYNLLNTKPKGSNFNYIKLVDYDILEDVTLIATSNEDTSVGSGKVFTSTGLYKVPKNFDYSNIGKKGDLVIKNSDEIVSFVASEQMINQYNIYQVLGSDIVVMENGKLTSLDVDNTLAIYNKRTSTTLGQLLSKISVGDVLTIYKTSDGTIDYGVLKTDELAGPVTYTNEQSLVALGLKNPSVTRNGSPSSLNDMEANDIIYYSKPLNTIWSYSTMVTGIYEKALPNKDNPTSVQISGKTYMIEGATAFNKLSSNGNFVYGDTITVMLGKNNQIADCLSTSEAAKETIYGYLIGTGTKEFTASDTNKYVNNFVKVVLADGTEYEYTSDKDYKDVINSVVKITFSNSKGKVSRVSGNLMGKFNWEAKTLGEFTLAPDVNILDVFSEDHNDVSKYAKIYPQRIDGITLRTENILYYSINDKNEITDLYLNNVTGDVYTYGIVKKAEKISNNMMMALGGTYTLIIDGAQRITGTSGVAFGVASGQPGKFIFGPTGTPEDMQPLNKLDGKITEISQTSITVLGKKYLLHDNAVVYLKDSNYDYTIIPISDLTNIAEYSLTAYYDKSQDSGGRIRIIVATK